MTGPRETGGGDSALTIPLLAPARVPARAARPARTARGPRSALPAVVALIALVAACSSPKPSAAPHQAAQVVAAASPAAPGPGRCPLTDETPPAGGSATRPILAVKIDGTNPNADPQAGLDQADIVYDEPIEGGYAWFLALFQCGDPPSVGPVREAEIEDPSILTQYSSLLYAFVPDVQAPVVRAVATTPGVVMVDAGVAGPAYSRNASRHAPYNLYADPAALRTAGTSRATATALSPPSPQFVFVTARATTAAAGPSPSASGQTQTLTFSLGPIVQYQYDAQTNAYLRFENGQPMMDAAGSQISVTNVVLMWTQINPSQIVDGAGNASPLPVMTGTGQAMVLTGGKEYDGTWSRSAANEPLSFLNASGKQIPMTPGNTWIHILNLNATASVQ